MVCSMTLASNMCTINVFSGLTSLKTNLIPNLTEAEQQFI